MRKAFRDHSHLKFLSVIVTFALLSSIQVSNYHNVFSRTQGHDKDFFALKMEETPENNESANPLLQDEKTTLLNELLQHPETNTTSLHILLDFLKTHEPTHRNGEVIIDTLAEEERCARFGFKYTGRKTRRRIFYGSNIADDSWHPIAAHAAEAYGLYHTVALVESNVTHMRTKRTMRFHPPEAIQARAIKGIWGPTTHVFMDYYHDVGAHIDRRGDSYGLIQEDLQRDLVLGRWIAQGMTTEDIGIIGDVDEFFTRDFLLAASSCDIPQFRPGQDCKRPKIAGSTLVFESAPDCITKGRRWYHPDMISGECLHGIGDSAKHPKAERVMDVGFRIRGYLRSGDDDKLLPENTTMFPLYKPSDTRMGGGGDMVQGKGGEHTAFHLHNFFNSIALLRKKYRTYSHGYKGEERLIPLGKFHEDIELTVRCITGRNDDHLNLRRDERGFKAIAGFSQPLAFKNERYQRARFDEIKDEILQDEEKYGIYGITDGRREGDDNERADHDE